MVSVLHLLSADLPTGTAMQIGHLATGLAAVGVTSQVCSLEHDQHHKNRIEPFLPRIDYCRQSSRLDPTAIIRCARKIRNYQPSVVHCWGRHRPTMVRLAIRVAGNCPSVWSVRSDAERDSYGKLVPGQPIITNAAHLAKAMAGRSVDVIENGIVNGDSSEVVSPIHHELGLDPCVRFIAAVGDLRQKKRWKDLVWSFDLLRVIHPNVHLLILGEGDQARNVRTFAASAACADGVHMLGYRNDVANVLRQSFCYWQASDDEGCSNAMLEAMAAGLPIIASDIAGHRDMLGDGRYGTLIPVGDCAEMARQTNVMMGSLDEANRRSSASRQYVFHRYSMAQMIGKYRSTYDALLTRRAVAA